MNRENGVCPHCGRADSVKEIEPREQYDRDNCQRFQCGGCKATWMGVRRQISQGIKTLRRAYSR